MTEEERRWVPGTALPPTCQEVCPLLNLSTLNPYSRPSLPGVPQTFEPSSLSQQPQPNGGPSSALHDFASSIEAGAAWRCVCVCVCCVCVRVDMWMCVCVHVCICETRFRFVDRGRRRLEVRVHGCVRACACVYV